jgi:hypothetical protein
VFVPTSVSAKQGETVFDLGKVIKLYAHDASVYVGDDWDINQAFKLNAGLRFSNFTQIGPFSRYKKDFLGRISDTVNYAQGKVVANYNGLEPRITLRYTITKLTSLKAAYTRNFQYIHLGSISSVSLPTDVWIIERENDKIHPTQKPIDLLAPSILNHTKRSEIIYEPFCGSGSTLIASEKLGRRCFALELEPAYIDVILTRWATYTGKDPVREDGVKWSVLSES